MNIVSRLICLSTLTVLTCAGIGSASTEVVRASQGLASRYPKIQIYTAPGCRSCAAASDYLTSNNIPFTRKDISQNSDYLDELAFRYKTRAVPVIVIGNDEKVLRGYIQEAFQMAVREVMAKQRH
jgi:glutaredoxin 3